MRRTIVALVAVLLIATGSTAFAGGEKGQWEIGVFLGYAWLDDYGFFLPDNDMLYGARIGHWFSNHWNLEFSGQRIGTDSEPEVLGMPDTSMELDALRLNALYNFGAGASVRPFLTAGIGYEKVEADDFGESCDFGWNAGGGLRFFFSPSFNLRLDGRYARIKVGDPIDDSQGNVEASAGLGLLFGGGDDEVAAVNQAPMVTCVADRAEILPGESVSFRATASDPEGDPLTYSWSASTGRVTGTGATAMFDFTGATPPTSSTVTVSVSDDHGNSTSSDCSVRLIQPARQAEAVSCIAGGFPANLSRLTNVDKACLDDVAQRMNADPRARVVVIGHADSRETSANVAQQRADAVRAYLVTERSIEGSRVTVRSAGSSKPLETGSDATAQAANRRVEVWFVPEGATVPD